MAKIEAAQNRIFKGIFICKTCSSKVKADPRKVAEGKVKCRKCKGTSLRVKRKKTGKQ